MICSGSSGGSSSGGGRSTLMRYFKMHTKYNEDTSTASKLDKITSAQFSQTLFITVSKHEQEKSVFIIIPPLSKELQIVINVKPSSSLIFKTMTAAD